MARNTGPKAPPERPRQGRAPEGQWLASALACAEVDGALLVWCSPLPGFRPDLPSHRHGYGPGPATASASEDRFRKTKDAGLNDDPAPLLQAQALWLKRMRSIAAASPERRACR
jgi:hypothetical protein